MMMMMLMSLLVLMLTILFPGLTLLGAAAVIEREGHALGAGVREHVKRVDVRGVGVRRLEHLARRPGGDRTLPGQMHNRLLVRRQKTNRLLHAVHQRSNGGDQLREDSDQGRRLVAHELHHHEDGQGQKCAHGGDLQNVIELTEGGGQVTGTGESARGFFAESGFSGGGLRFDSLPHGYQDIGSGTESSQTLQKRAVCGIQTYHMVAYYLFANPTCCVMVLAPRLSVILPDSTPSRAWSSSEIDTSDSTFSTW
jgi:hypothetical protein